MAGPCSRFKARVEVTSGGKNVMTNHLIVKRWRKHLARELQDRYGLQEEEARMKADKWLRSIDPQQVSAAQSRLSRTNTGCFGVRRLA